jgi:hypothetical protein
VRPLTFCGCSWRGVRIAHGCATRSIMFYPDWRAVRHPFIPVLSRSVVAARAECTPRSSFVASGAKCATRKVVGAECASLGLAVPAGTECLPPVVPGCGALGLILPPETDYFTARKLTLV